MRVIDTTIVAVDKPKYVTDRKIKYKLRYDIGYGHAFSDSFSKASKRELGWSHGVHGLRHTFAQDRMKELTNHCNYKESLLATSQELGHLRTEITLVYLR
ncbi:hypothetical protein [Vibrio breoganii]|uniref:hypothetical protein n=1 Tax=Vibrio breoganii TaxID=553239 RepID=UPI0010569214|nr:hypothetical protein [Vibrio breoganii]